MNLGRTTERDEPGCRRRLLRLAFRAERPGRARPRAQQLAAGMGRWNFPRTTRLRSLLRPGRAHSGAFTLIELMVVVTIIGILTALIIPEMKGSYQDALLRSTSRDLIDVFDLAYSRAVSLNQVRRVQLNEKTGRFLVEKQVLDGGQEKFIPVDETGGAGEVNSKITLAFQRADETPDAEADQSAMKGALGEAPDLGASITFYPDGTADPGVIELTDRDGFRLALKINPITARVQVEELARK
jgi:type II secretion system protein H